MRGEREEGERVRRRRGASSEELRGTQRIGESYLHGKRDPVSHSLN
jgi:hypothetical protein